MTAPLIIGLAGFGVGIIKVVPDALLIQLPKPHFDVRLVLQMRRVHEPHARGI